MDMLKFFVNKNMHLQKSKKKFFNSYQLQKKILLPTLLTTLSPTSLILLNEIVTIMLLSLTLIYSLSYLTLT